MIPHNRLTFNHQEITSVAKVVASGFWAGGKKVKALESLMSKKVHVNHSIATSSGSGALRLALHALGVKKGKEVIIPAYSCVALPNAVLSLGAIPVPVDICRDTWNIDPRKVSKAISNSTCAIIIVNTFGLSAEIAHIQDMKIPIIEDCSHGFLINEKKQLFANRSHISIASFYATKLIGAGEGGIVMTNSQDVASIIYGWRDYDGHPPSGLRFNEKMNDLEAALAICQIKKLNSMIDRRNKLARKYHKKLKALSVMNSILELPITLNFNRIWYRYTIKLNNSTGSVIIEMLQKRGIQAEKPIENWLSQDISKFPNSQDAYENLVSIPLYPTLTKEEQDYICKSLGSILTKLA